MTMTLHNYRSRQFHRTLNGVNLSSGFKFRDMCSTKSGPHWCQFWQVLGPWASPYGANWQMIMTLHNFRSRQFHWALNSENPSGSFRDMHSAKSVSPAAHPPGRTSMTIPLQPGGLRVIKRNWNWNWNWSWNWIANKANLRDLIAATGLVISNWIQIVNFSARVTVKFDGWPCKTIGHLFYATSSFVHNFVPIGEFKLELQSGNAQSGSKSTIFLAVWPRNFTDDPQKQ